MAEFASKGVAGTGLGLGITGTALGLLNNNGGLLSGLFGGGRSTNSNELSHGYDGHCSHNTVVNRRELQLEKELVQGMAAKDAIIAKLEGERYTDNKVQEAVNRIDNLLYRLDTKTTEKFAGVDAQFAAQGIVNGQVTANLACMQQTIATLQGVTKTIIPITNVCPEPMPKYNGWVDPAGV